MNKLDYALRLIEMLALEMIERTPDHGKIKWVLDTAKSLRNATEKDAV